MNKLNKWLLLGACAMVLVGCKEDNSAVVESSSEATQSQVSEKEEDTSEEVVTSEESEESESEEESKEEEKVKTDVVLTTDDAIFGQPAEPTEVHLVTPPGYEEGNQITEMMEQFIEANPTVGEYGSIVFAYTGNYIQTDDYLVGIFFIVNKTQEDLNDFDLEVGMAIKDEALFENYNLQFRKENMGTLTNDGIIPITIVIDKEHEELLASVENYEDILITMGDFDILDLTEDKESEESEETETKEDNESEKEEESKESE